jgi:hypothetical protein
MTKFQWRTESATELATLLRQAEIQNSAAIGANTIYQIMHEGREKLAISLAGGQMLIVESVVAAKTRRRRVDPVKKAAQE